MPIGSSGSAAKMFPFAMGMALLVITFFMVGKLQAEEAACPKQHISSGLQPVTTNCAPCNKIVKEINLTINLILTLEKRINKTIDELNELCPDDDDPRDTAPPTVYGEEIDPDASYCGPDVTSAMMAALARVHQRMKKLPDNEKGIFDAAEPFVTDSFMMRNMINSDQKPIVPSSSKCPSGVCAQDGNAAGQPCFTLYGKCVPMHVLNDIMYGFIADQLYVPELVQAIGGQFHQWQNYKGWAIEPSASREAYDFGDEISEDYDWDEVPTPDTVQDDLALLLDDIQDDYPWIKDCKVCPYPEPFLGWKSDMSRRAWTLYDGTYLNFDGSITSQPIDYKIEENKARKKEERRQKRFKEVQTKLATELAQLARHKQLLSRQQTELPICERQCNQGGMGTLTGILGGFELVPDGKGSTTLVGTTNISGEAPFGQGPGNEQPTDPGEPKTRKPKPPAATPPSTTTGTPTPDTTPTLAPSVPMAPSQPSSPTPDKCRTANVEDPKISLRHLTGTSGLCFSVRIIWDDESCAGAVEVAHERPNGASSNSSRKMDSQINWQNNIYSYGIHKIQLRAAYNTDGVAVQLSGQTYFDYNVGSAEQNPGDCYVE